MFGSSLPEIMASSVRLIGELDCLAERRSQLLLDVREKAVGAANNDAESDDHRGDECQEQRVFD
jgi:hypothetical protein